MTWTANATRSVGVDNGLNGNLGSGMAIGNGATARFAGTGHRMTAPRKAVLRAVDRADGPFSIEEIYDAAPEVGRATAFRTMKLLQEVGVVCRVPLEDGSVRYQLAESEAHHHHLVCSTCGSVSEFSDHSLDRGIEQSATAAGFELDGHSVELYGRCAECRQCRPTGPCGPMAAVAANS